MKPYFYVKAPIDKKQYYSNGAKPISNGGTKLNEISIYEIINKENGFKRNNNGNGNGNQLKKDFDRQVNSEKTSGFVRKVVNPESLNKDKSLVQEKSKGIKPNHNIFFTKYFENLSNFHILLRNVTPFIDVKRKQSYERITIEDYFYSAFEKPSIFGMETPVIYESNSILIADEVVNLNFSPTISSFEFHISNQDLRVRIFKEISQKKNENNYKEHPHQSGGNTAINKLYEYHIFETGFRVIGYENKVSIEFYEQKPHHYRHNFLDQFEIFFDHLECLRSSKVFTDFDKNSWFSILWIPLKTLKTNLQSTSFLCYYSLNNFEETKSLLNFHEFPVIGVLPLKLDEHIWLSKINKNEFKMFDIEYKICLEKSVSNVHEFLFTHTSQTSVDYDFFFKNSF